MLVRVAFPSGARHVQGAYVACGRSIVRVSEPSLRFLHRPQWANDVTMANFDLNPCRADSG